MRPGRVLAVVVVALAFVAPTGAAGRAAARARVAPAGVGRRVVDQDAALERASVAAALARRCGRPPGAGRPFQAGAARLALGRLPHGRYAVNVVARDPSGLRTSVTRAVRLPQIVTVAVSGDLLIHTPVAARALANGGRWSYRFGPMLARISPSSAGPIALCHLEHPLGRGPPTGYRVSAPRSRWPARSARQASTSAARPRTTPSTTASPASSPPWPPWTGPGSATPAAGRGHPRAARPRGGPGVMVGIVSATEHTNGIAPPYPWSVALADGRHPGGRPRRPPRRGAGRHRQHALGRRVPARADALTVASGSRSHGLARRDRRRRPARPRRAADPVRERQARGVRRGEPGVQPVRGLSGRHDRPPRPRRDPAGGSGRRVRYLPTYVHRPDYVVVPATGTSAGARSAWRDEAPGAAHLRLRLRTYLAPPRPPQTHG